MRGRSANRAKLRLSCSLLLDMAEGSSQATMTSPPLLPLRFKVMRKSEHTLTPFCFMATIALRPAREAVVAASSATISLVDHSTYRLKCSATRASDSVISVEGGPGQEA